MAGSGYTWTVTGNTALGAFTSSYQSEHAPLDLYVPEIIAQSFTATSAGNNTLDLAYNIVSPDPTDTDPALASMTVTLYASASGLFYDPNNVQAASPYVYNDNNNGGAWLSGSDQKVLSLDGGGLTPSLLEQYATFSDGWNMSDFYILAEINTTSSDTDSNTYSDTQWVRLQVGAFQNGGAVYVMGTASLDNPTPDVQATDTFTITGSGRTNPYYTVVSGPADDGTGDTFTRNFGGILVRRGPHPRRQRHGRRLGLHRQRGLRPAGHGARRQRQRHHLRGAGLRRCAGRRRRLQVHRKPRGRGRLRLRRRQPAGEQHHYGHQRRHRHFRLQPTGAGINLDLDSGGDLGGLGSLALTLGENDGCTVLGTNYGDTIQRDRALSLAA